MMLYQINQHSAVKFWGGLVGVLVGLLIIFGLPYRSEYARNPVPELSKTGAVFFYRDDCPTCKQIYRTVYWQNKIRGLKVTQVNLVQGKNRHYISRFALKSVPTFVYVRHGKVVAQYSGTNLKQILKVEGGGE